MIQDIDNTFYNQYKNTEAGENDVIIEIVNDSILLAFSNGTIVFPVYSDNVTVNNYLFTIDKTNYFSGTLKNKNGYEFYNIRNLRDKGSKTSVFAAITAYHLCSWYDSQKFCGCCGNKMKHSPVERAMVCECGNTVYPRINPAVIVAIISENRICMTKYNRGYANWALVAGYCEAGETIEETVHREVMEETGLRVKNLHFYKSQPWGLSSSLLFGFFCETDGSDKITIDNVELKEGKWFTAEEIEFFNDDFSLTREMIEVFRQKKHIDILNN